MLSFDLDANCMSPVQGKEPYHNYISPLEGSGDLFRIPYQVRGIRPYGTIFSNVDFSRCRLSASSVKFPQMYLRNLVFDIINGLLWYVLISNSAEKATSTGKVLS